VTASGSRNTLGRDRQSYVIDEQHLARMTLGDLRLEREVLDLFLKQAALMLDRIATGSPTVAAAAAHTLKGSACGIGIWRLARAGESFERAVADANEVQINEALSELRAASLEASAAIAVRLGRSFIDRTYDR